MTGGMPSPVAGYVSLSIGKAALRTLVALVDQEFGAHGVHAATVTVAGAVAPGGLVLIDDDPDYLSVAPDGSFRSRCNTELVGFDEIGDADRVRGLIEEALDAGRAKPRHRTP